MPVLSSWWSQCQPLCRSKKLNKGLLVPKVTPQISVGRNAESRPSRPRRRVHFEDENPRSRRPEVEVNEHFIPETVEVSTDYPDDNSGVINAVEGTMGNPYITVSVDGVKVLGCVDTGAVKTIISSAAMEAIDNDYLDKLVPSSTPLKSATNHPLIILGEYPTTLTIGEHEIPYRIVVHQQQRKEFLLGNDLFLDRFINVGSRHLRAILRNGRLGKPIPIRYRADGGRVATAYKVVIPPHTAKRINATYSAPVNHHVIGRSVIVEPSEDWINGVDLNVQVEPSCSVVTSAGTIACVVSNTSDEPVELPKDLDLGSVTVAMNDDVDLPKSTNNIYQFYTSIDKARDDLYHWTINQAFEEMHDREGENDILHGSKTGELPEPPGYEGTDFTESDPAETAKLDHLTAKQQSLVRTMIRKYPKAFAKSDADIGTTNLLTHKIDVTGVKPIAQPYRPVPEKYQEEVNKMINELLKLGVITDAKQSPWAANLVIVKKKDSGKLRICCDLRGPNSVSKNRNRWPIRNIEESFSKLAKAKYVTSIDLLAAYWTIKMDPDSSKVTGFYGPNATHYQWLRMPFGLAGAPHTYSQVMAKILRNLDKYVFNYFDDVIVFSDSFEEHLQHLEEVIKRFEQAGFKINTKKCNWLCHGQMPFEWLGSVISAGTIMPDEKKLKAIDEMCKPESVKAVQKFVGAVNFHRRHLKDLSKIIAPLTALTKLKKEEFEWKAEHDVAFQEVKAALKVAPALQLPDISRPFIVSSDASGVALGCTLSQIDNEGNERICAYASRKFTDIEIRNMSMPEKELAGILYGIKTWIYYLANNKFTIRTDARSLIFLKRFNKCNSKISRASLWLTEFDFDICHVSRKTGNTIALCDYMSRAVDADTKLVTYKALKNPALNDWPDVPLTGIVSMDEFDVVAEKYIKDNPIDEKYSVNVIEVDEHDDDVMDECFIEDEVIELSGTNGDEFCINTTERIQHVALTESCMTNDTFRILQAEDKTLGAILKKIREDPRSSNLYHLRKGILMTGAAPDHKLMVPESLQQALIAHYHGGLAGCHVGAKKLYRRISKAYHWAGMESDIRDYVRHCKLCQHNSVYPVGALGLGLSKTPVAPNQLIMIDCITGLPRSATGNKVILTIVDDFTKFTRAVPVKNKEAATIASAVTQHWISFFGPPKQIHSDEGGEVDSKLMFNLCSLLNIRKSHTPAYHPQSNGVCEAMNKTIGTMLKTLIDGSTKRQWDELLPFMISAYNSLPHTTTGYSPNELVFGRDLSHQIVPLIPEEHEVVSKSQYLNDLRSNQAAYWQIVRTAMESQKLKRQADSSDRRNPYKIGDFVLIKDMRPMVAKTSDEKGTKLRARYIGPFRVIRSDPSVLHIIHWKQDAGMHHERLPVHIQGNVIRPEVQVIHPDLCKPYYGDFNHDPILNQSQVNDFLRQLGILDPEESPDIPAEPQLSDQERAGEVLGGHVPMRDVEEAIYGSDDEDDFPGSDISTPPAPHHLSIFQWDELDASYQRTPQYRRALMDALGITQPRQSLAGLSPVNERSRESSLSGNMDESFRSTSPSSPPPLPPRRRIDTSNVGSNESTPITQRTLISRPPTLARRPSPRSPALRYSSTPVPRLSLRPPTLPTATPVVRHRGSSTRHRFAWMDRQNEFNQELDDARERNPDLEGPFTRNRLASDRRQNMGQVSERTGRTPHPSRRQRLSNSRDWTIQYDSEDTPRLSNTEFFARYPELRLSFPDTPAGRQAARLSQYQRASDAQRSNAEYNTTSVRPPSEDH